eukprot:TRINITY_DN11978_c0_g1_i1.p1 TRINITY_DN11978_c0_g1~~TRINITY_DN11978_c0_g1_i1.p1  ORF type:complete len:1008 (-),score=128.69 TRINITY_DN11978_c0_g1_i1:657-3296(-)
MAEADAAVNGTVFVTQMPCMACSLMEQLQTLKFPNGLLANHSAVPLLADSAMEQTRALTFPNALLVEHTMVHLPNSTLNSMNVGSWNFCQCGLKFTNGGADSLMVGKLLLSGASPTQKVSCARGRKTCKVSIQGFYLYSGDSFYLRRGLTCGTEQRSLGAGVSPGNPYISTLNSTNSDEAFVAAAPVDLQSQVDVLPAGRYRICHCRPADTPWLLEWFTELIKMSLRGPIEGWMYANQPVRNTSVWNCSLASQFSSPAGTLEYKGPGDIGRLVRPLGVPLVLDSIYGTGLSGSDKVRLQQTCTQDNDFGPLIEAEASGLGSSYTFDLQQGVLATTYHLCWCQVDLLTQTSCKKSTDFGASFGVIDLVCPADRADLNGDGVCQRCPWFWQKPDDTNTNCMADLTSVLASLASVLVGALGMLAVLSQFHFHFGIRARLIYIDDISKEDGRSILTIVGNHNLRSCGSTVAARLVNTGLEDNPAFRGSYQLRILGKSQMELLSEDGQALERMDSSMGVVRLNILSILRFGLIPLLALPAAPIGIMLLTISLAVLQFKMLEASAVETLMVASFSFILAFPIALLIQNLRGTSSAQYRKLLTYAQKLAEPILSERGPSRAVTAFQLLDLHEHFQASIRDRNMYYICPNIVMPLTSKHEISFAELVGPHQVQWFISHWWGTQFQYSCDAIRRHAISSSGEDCWLQNSYWVCTFSNNQYRVAEELGSTHEESSFYLALYSSGCLGTCMILDDKAHPLTRSWCLFEFLQTMKLEERLAPPKGNFQGIFFCTRNGVLSRGDGATEVVMNMGKRLATLKLEDAVASTPEDHDMIMTLVIKEMGSFDHINEVLRQHVSKSLQEFKQCLDTGFATIFQDLQGARADITVESL